MTAVQEPVVDYYRSYLRFVSNQRVLKSRWAKLANCAKLSPSLMYPTSYNRQVAIATTYCATCPVRQECLELALLGDETEGVWGGVVERDRKVLLDTIHELIDPKKFWDPACMEIISEIATKWFEDQVVEVV